MYTHADVFNTITIIKDIQNSTVSLLMHVYRNAHFSDETCYPRGLRKAGGV